MSLRRVVLSLVACSALWLPAAAADPLPPAAEWISPQAVLCLEVSKPEAVLDVLLHPRLLDAIRTSPAFKQQADSDDFRQLRNLVRYIERQIGDDWQTGLRQLLGGGVTLAVGPKDASVLIVDSENAETLKQLHNVMQYIAESEADKRNDPNRVRSVDYRGVTTWTFGPKEAHAIIGSRLVITNRPQELVALLDRRAAPGGPSLAQSPAYLRAKKAAGSSAAATAYADMSVLKQLPKVKKALQGNENPMAVLLLAGMLEALRESEWLALTLDVKDDTFALALTTDAAATGTGAAAFTLPPGPDAGAMPNLSVPRQVAAASLYRDLHGFYAAKDDLFPERTSQLIFFENMMGIFFTGRDLTEDVLAETGADVRLVVAQQEYDPAIGTPEVQVPSFAFVMRLKNPKKFQPVVEEAWQKALGLINFTRGQQALPGLIIDRPKHGDTTYTMSYFSAPTEPDGGAADMRFNFQPSLAMPGDYLILSSTRALAEGLIDALQKEAAGDAKPQSGAHSLAEIDGSQLASILAANRENMVRQNMVEKGHTREQAEGEIDMLLMIARRVGSLKMEAGSNEGRSRATLQLQLNMASD